MDGVFTIALDKSVRRRDADGRLHVDLTNISKANVCPYYGREIPGLAELGLKPDQVYQLLRDPQELAKAAPTFNNVPLLDEHVIVSADDPKKNNVVGSTGTDAEFNGEYLRNSLVVWDAEAIARIESGEQKQISCAYRYKPDMTHGNYRGLRYDGVMRSIEANHVALVREGRAGPDVVVADGKLGEVRMKFSALKPKLAAKFAVDAALTTLDRQYLVAALDEMEEEAEDEDWEPEEHEAEDKAKDKAKDKAAKDKAAKDKAAKDAKRAKDKAARDMKRAKDETEQDKDAEEQEAEDESEEEEQEPARERGEDKKAKDKRGMDKSAMDSAIAKAVANERAKWDALAAAKSDVLPIVGEVHGMDSAEAVYRFALDAQSVPHKDIKEVAALKQMVALVRRPGSVAPVMATDAKTRDNVADLFPQLARYA